MNVVSFALIFNLSQTENEGSTVENTARTTRNEPREEILVTIGVITQP